MSQVKSIRWSHATPLLTDFSLVVLSSLVISLLGQIEIPLPFTPIPLATRPQFILLLAAFLGPRRAFLATLFFLVQGAMGLPVFANGMSGIGALIGPRGGYLLGYLAAAFVTGTLLEKMKEATFLQTFFSMAAGNAVIFLLGFAYLSIFVGLEKGFFLGVAPFLLGDALKLVFCAKIFHVAQTKLKGA